PPGAGLRLRSPAALERGAGGGGGNAARPFPDVGGARRARLAREDPHGRPGQGDRGRGGRVGSGPPGARHTRPERRLSLPDRQRRAPERAREAARTERVAGFLASAGGLLASSLDCGETLAGVAELAVRSLADFCIIDVVEGGEVNRLQGAHADPERAELTRE